MLKTAGLIALGIGVGAVATLLLCPTSNGLPTEGDLSAATESESITKPAARDNGSTSSYDELVASSRPTQGYVVSELVAAGFTRDRAEWINHRFDELYRESVEASVSLEAYANSPEGRLRDELEATEFERYLSAIGEVPAVRVGEVIDTSPAAIAGLRMGDRILSYGGRRVFDIRELIPLSLQGATGEGVVVGIVRNDEPMQLVIPRGPLKAELYSGQFYAAPSLVPKISNQK